MPDGTHWIAGEAVNTTSEFTSDAGQFPVGTPDLVNQAVAAAEAAFAVFAATSSATRTDLLSRIADGIDANTGELTRLAMAESRLPEARLTGECGRTSGQLRLFATHIAQGDYLDRRIDTALPDSQPMPRPELRMIQRPVGPVAVFGASNFPLAFSVAGGDTASALAAGCPVVVKGHPAHPGVSSLVAQIISSAVADAGLPAGVFSMVHDGGIAVGTALVQHPLITAVGFTGSLRGGRALFDLCAARDKPIPFFGELGSVNPMFLLPDAVSARGAEIGAGWAGSLAMGAGQFCTNPGVAIAVDGPELDALLAAADTALAATPAQDMLTAGIADAYRAGTAGFDAIKGLTKRVGDECDGQIAKPFLFETTGDAWLADPNMAHEVFGPAGIIVRARDTEQMLQIARELDGQLTVTLHLDDGDHDLARQVLPLAERAAGRVLVNGYPTGVEVADTMVHGGPYPASTNFGATSVGTMAIRRWLRPVCYQNLPAGLLPSGFDEA